LHEFTLVNERLAGREDGLAMFRSALARAPRAALVAVLAAAGALAAAFPASAEVHDVRVGVDGGRAEIAIVFDAAPTGATAAPGGAGIVVFASGVAASPRRIETASGGLLRMVEVRAGEGGVELDLALTSEAAAARSWIDGRTLRVTITLAGIGGAAPQSMAAAPEAGAMSVGAGAGAAGPSETGAPSSSPTAMDAAASAAAWLPAATSAAPGATTSGATTPGATTSATPGGASQVAMTSPATPPAQGVEAAMTARAPSDVVYAPSLRAGAEGALSAASPAPSDGAADASRPPGPPRDRGRPSVIFAGAITEEECDAADTTVRSDPWDLVSLKRYASCRAIDGDPAGAEQAFRRLLTFTPDDTDAELGLAAVRHEQGAVAEAAAVYERLLADATGDAEAARLRALLALAAAGR
jgi:hypothetical protein